MEPPIKRVLIADDKSAIRSALKMFLGQRADLEVCDEAADGMEAVEKARSLKPDVILLDVSMPVMNGLQAASILRRMLPAAAIILFTMYSEHLRVALDSSIGVDAILSKPDGLPDLCSAIDTVLARRFGNLLPGSPVPVV
jgi:DNA-binding NarL/FixJ family response regulator